MFEPMSNARPQVTQFGNNSVASMATGRRGYARHRTDGMRAFVQLHGRLESEQEFSLHPLHYISPV